MKTSISSIFPDELPELGKWNSAKNWRQKLERSLHSGGHALRGQLLLFHRTKNYFHDRQKLAQLIGMRFPEG
jgi:hypothetical protein